MQILHETRIVEKINLSSENVIEITMTKLRKMVYPGEYLKKDKGKFMVMNAVEHYHGSDSEEVVREATDTDLAIFKIIDILQKEKRGK